MAASGRAGVIAFFSARKPTPLPEKMKTKIVAVVAEGDYVTVVTPQVLRPTLAIRVRRITPPGSICGASSTARRMSTGIPQTIAAPNPNAKGKQ